MAPRYGTHIISLYSILRILYCIMLDCPWHNVSEINMDEDEDGTLVVALLIFK